jgi:PilZ domain
MPFSIPIQPERRRTARHTFGGVAEVTATQSGKYLVAIASEISRLGCFVKTMTPFTSGEPVDVKITYSSRAFSATGRVIYALPAKGMGITFGAISADDQLVLEDWLAETSS